MQAIFFGAQPATCQGKADTTLITDKLFMVFFNVYSYQSKAKHKASVQEREGGGGGGGALLYRDIGVNDLAHRVQ